MTQQQKKLTPARRIARVLVWTVLALVVFFRFMAAREHRLNPGPPNGFFWEKRQQQVRFRRGPTLLRPPRSAVPNDLPRIQIEIAPQDLETLRGYYWNGMRGEAQERPEVLVTVREGQMVYTNVALHSKGAAGSFRPIDDKPALTLNFHKHARGQRFHNYTKISLNNSVQDSTYLCEALCRELFEAAGIPVPRADWATVLINGRDLGLYVMLEGADKEFLRRYFKNVKGNLYDGGFCQEVNPNLKASSGEAREDHSDIQRFLSAFAARDPEELWKRLNKVLDTDRFITSMAMEVLICHWDGYVLNRNNYRFYHDLDRDLIVFIPHGMDQMFGLPEWERRSSPESSIQPAMKGLVARALMKTAQGRRMYFERLASLRANLFQEEPLVRRVHELDQRIRPTLAAYDPAWAHRHDAEVATLCAHIHRRILSVDAQLNKRKASLAFEVSGRPAPTN